MTEGDPARAWLILARTPGLGPRTLEALRARCGDSPDAILAARRGTWRDAGLPAAGCDWLAAPDATTIAEDQAWLAQPGHDLITRDDPRYPRLLAELPDAPAWLFTIGDTDLLAAPGFAVVGSRNPSRDGIEHARGFAAELAGAGLAVVSGLADGIDAAAHAGALDAEGMTVAVCGTGLDRVYPARNRELARRIAETGLLVSEYARGTPALRANFPRRNRIIAGLSVGVLVVEAARTSGSLITARLGRDHGREVFALPGSIHNPLARGCHRLIREGARLAESSADILAEIAPQLPRPAAGAAPSASPAEPDQGEAAAPDGEHQRLLACMGDAPVDVDTLVERAGLTPDAVSSMLLILELQGFVTSGPGGVFTRKR